MPQDELFKLIHGYFLKTGAWPSCRTVQIELGTQQNLRLLAAEIGPTLIVCNGGENGECSLTLTAMAEMEGARDDLKLLARAVGFAAEQYVTVQPERVTASMFGEATKTQGIALRRLGALLGMVNHLWSSHGAGDDFFITCSENAIFFQGVRNYSDLRDVQLRLDSERRRTAERLTHRWQTIALRVDHELGVPWPKVESQLATLRERMSSANKEEDFQGIGLICREIIISLAQAAHDPEKHISTDGVEPSPTDAKRKLGAFLEHELRGGTNEEARNLVKAAMSFAVALQHNRMADQCDAALCSEATIALVRITALVAEHRSS